MRERAVQGPAHRQGWKRTYFTPEEEVLLGTDVDRVIAECISKTTSAVSNRRHRLGIPAFKKWQSLFRNGYLFVYVKPGDPFHDMTRGDSRVAEHRFVMAQHLGRPLTVDESVHHRNGEKTDNRIENLELWVSTHPSGQRVEDVMEWCVEFIERYADELSSLQDTSFSSGARE